MATPISTTRQRQILALLLGALWGLAYAFIHMLHPGAFRTAEATESLDTGAFLYFSLVALTTTGYGDMVPVSRLVRALASLEGVAGQLYVAILVATLVSQYVAPRGDEPEEREAYAVRRRGR